jgi:hypothetical protein
LTADGGDSCAPTGFSIFVRGFSAMEIDSLGLGMPVSEGKELDGVVVIVIDKEDKGELDMGTRLLVEEAASEAAEPCACASASFSSFIFLFFLVMTCNLPTENQKSKFNNITR